MTEFLSSQLLQAIEYAAHAHRTQNRKCPPDMPYVSHCTAVGMILLKAGFSEEVVIAGILHDTVEDTNVTFADISKQFGVGVMSLVQGVTEDAVLEWADRKAAYNEHLKTVTKEVAAISAADLLANRLDQLLLLRAGENPWVHFSKEPQTYVEKVKKNDTSRIEIIKTILNHPLLAELESVQKETFALTDKIEW